MAVIALDLGGTKLSAAIFSSSGAVLHKKYFLLEGRGGSAVGALITGAILEMSRQAREADIALTAVGICIPGISHGETGRVWAPNIAGWEDYPLYREIENALADEPLSIVLDNDRACSVLGECWKGSARGCEHVIFLAVGTGIGAGIITANQVLRGADDIAGAIGWMGLQRPYLEKYERCGNFEYYASGEGLIRAARELVAEDQSYQGALSEGSLRTESIFQAYHADDGIAKKVVQQAAAYWGMAMGNLISIFNPQTVVFGGGLFGPAVELLPMVKAEAEKWAQPVAVTKVRLEASALGRDAALYGVAFQALAASENKGK